MEPVSQLVLRNAPLLGSNLLLCNAPPDHLCRELQQDQRQVATWNQEFGPYRWFGDQGISAAFGVVPEHALPREVVLFLPREKARLDMLLHFLAARLPADGKLWLAGENQSGIRSAAARLRKFFSTVSKADAARHCALLHASQAKQQPAFRLDDYRQKWLLGSPPNELRMVSLPGAFAHGRLDRGSELLLEVLSRQQGEDFPAGRVLDFACGIGVIGLYLLRRGRGLELTLLDHSALALASARMSLDANGLEAEILPADGLAELDRQFDWIVTNPPFHRGAATDYDIARRFFAQAPGVLRRNGRLVLVSNRHLPYEGWLDEYFTTVETLDCTNEFKVLAALRPKSWARGQ
jgi:16S rRNA (guanine1207-N2)-methyltransferase